jgi:hypothetical protein
MRRPRWYEITVQQPKQNGRYWVFPYRTLDGHIMVTMASFNDGEWISPSRPQNFVYWKPIEIPEPPKTKFKRSPQSNGLEAE